MYFSEVGLDARVVFRSVLRELVLFTSAVNRPFLFYFIPKFSIPGTVSRIETSTCKCTVNKNFTSYFIFMLEHGLNLIFQLGEPFLTFI
jgi:hypothetical protein